MTRTAARLAELDRISRERSLTDEEQRAVLLLAKRERQYAAERERGRYVPRERSKRDVALAKARDHRGRFARGCGHTSGDQRLVENAGREA